MATKTKSVFLYGKPTKCKGRTLHDTQKEYTRLVNLFIGEMVMKTEFYLDLLTNNKQSPRVRKLEKELRSSHQLGSAYGQNAIDMAVKELHNHYIRIRNQVYGYIQHKHSEMENYISYKSLLNASLLDLCEEEVLSVIIEREQGKKKPSQAKIDEYKQLLSAVQSLSVEQREYYKETVATLFTDRLSCAKTPFVKHIPLQLDTRLSTIENSHSTKEHFIVSVKLLGEKDRVDFPVSTSKNSIRRLKQYKAGSMTISFRNGKVRVGIPVQKKVETRKSKDVISADMGITDLLYTNTGHAYGTFIGMTDLYEELVEKKLGQRSSLRNTMREYQKQLRVSKNEHEKAFLRKKIHTIASNLNGKKSLQKCRRQYAHEANKRMDEAVFCFVREARDKLVALEDLDITEFDRGKKNNKRDSSWVRGQLVKKITEKLDWFGIPYRLVDPAYTSKMCPKCFHIHSDNRKNKDFVCTVCKHHDDADHNAAVNIENRVNDKEVSEIVDKYRYSTPKRHEALKELFEKRHRSYLESTLVA